MLSKRTLAAVSVSGFSLAFMQSAYAYKVKKICEEVSTKKGPVEKCRWVRDKDSAERSKPANKGKDAKK